MAGRYIINQTAGKRVVILDEDADKVEGGYFNTDGTWVPFGGDDGMIYKGKTFKIKENYDAMVSSSYTNIPIYAENVGQTGAYAIVVYLMGYSTKRLRLQTESTSLASPPAPIDWIDNNGDITSAGESGRLYLPYGIVPEAKERFDVVFEEVTEE